MAEIDRRPIIAQARDTQLESPEPALAYTTVNDITHVIAANIIVPEDAEIASRYPALYPVLFLAM